MSLSNPQRNRLLPNAVQKRLNSLFARDTGFSGPQILDFFSQYSNDIERYPWGGGAPSRWQIFEDCMARFDIDTQKRIIADLLVYNGPMSHGRPSPHDMQYIQAWIEETGPPAPTPLAVVPPPVTTLNWNYVNREWTKASGRVSSDPPGAVTSARTLLETVCRHILDVRGVQYALDGDLPRLYGLTAKALNLSPDQHQQHIVKRLLGACSTIANSLAALRNVYGDSHGRGIRDKEAEPRHARLAVNAACSLALFLMETHLAQAE
jgi:hypothetical protein